MSALHKYLPMFMVQRPMSGGGAPTGLLLHLVLRKSVVPLQKPPLLSWAIGLGNNRNIHY
jgi:hypothetical protein